MNKGEETKKTPEDLGIEVEAMPPEFYGGANPVIKFKEALKEVNLNKNEVAPKPAEKKAFEKKAAAGGNLKFHPANLLSSPKFLLAVSGALLLLFALGGGGYYFFVMKKNQNAPLTLPPPAVSPPVAVEEISPTETPTTTVAEEPPPLPSLQETPLKFPSQFLADTADSDKDTLTDVAEELFTTDPNMADTDGDKYTDDTEIYNLYNPAGLAPMRLMDSGLVKEYTNPIYNYKIYYPAAWAVGNVDPQYKDVLFSTLNGENVEVRVFGREASAFEDWFTKWAPDQKLADLKPYQTYFKDPGNKRFDDLTYYFMDGSNIYVIVMHPFDSAPDSLSYRSVVKMMARSFRLNGTPELFTPRIEEVNPLSPATSELNAATGASAGTSTNGGL